MSRLTKSDDELLVKALAAAYGDTEGNVDDPPPPRSQPASTTVWVPNLNETQWRIFEDPAQNILGYGEKGSGKSIGFGHKIVRHAYENDNALVLILAPSMRTGNEGIWHDLETLILPAWRDGNRDKHGNLLDHGIGLEYTQAKLDPNTKDRHRWIRNRFGGWSKLLLMSIPYGSQVQQRIKGPAPSMVYIDELTQCDSREYFTYAAAQLGRRRGIHGPQQFCASCNPEGPSHWVYQVFFVECVNEQGKRSPNYAVYHVPIKENERWLPDGYMDRLEELLKFDDIERRRLILGEWIDRPTGEGLFKEYYIASIHLKGDEVRGEGLRPVAGFPIIIGYDLGQVYSAVTFMQQIPTLKKTLWSIFDEVDHLKEKILYKNLAWEVIERMRYWQKLVGYEFQYMHITDESAVNQWRPGGEGSYDAWEFEREYNRVAAELGNRLMKMLPCPKGEGSVPARVRLLQAKLYQEEAFISALCKNTKDMVMRLEADDKDPEKPKRSKWVHKFDSVTYPMFKLEMQGGIRNYLQIGQAAPSLIRCGAEQ